MSNISPHSSSCGIAYAVNGEVKVDTGPRKLQGGPQVLAEADTLDAFVVKKDPRSMIQSRFDGGPDMSVGTDKDAVKAAKRAERDGKRSKAAAEAAAAEVKNHLVGDKPTIKRNLCVSARL
jgi:hypothetical protein